MNALLGIDNSVLSNIENIAFSNDSAFNHTISELHILRPALLTDVSRLPEVYDLRLDVWEHSGNSEFVNRKLYPNGWFDDLDETAFHWAVFNDQNKIVASARLNLFYSFADFPYYSSIQKFTMPASAPFAFFSRLVVDPHYRQIGLSRKLFNSRAVFCEERGVKWSQVFINNPQILNQFEKSGYRNIGLTDVTYHASSTPHPVNVLIKENDCL
jgi:GNAT superfamily N-acetyltransferase